MRARNIKPAYFKNDVLGELDPLVRILFAGLWCYADRNGYFECRPKKIKAEVLPYDNLDVESALASLATSGFLQGYKYEDEKVYKIVSFEKHQRPHHNEVESIYDKTKLETYNQGRKRVQPRKQALRPDILIPDTGYLNDDIRKEDTLNEERGSDEFALFYEAYPRKAKRPLALKAFDKAKVRSKLNGNFLTVCLQAIESHKKTKQWQDSNFIPLPASWLNQDSFNDKINIEQSNLPQATINLMKAIAKDQEKEVKEIGN